MAAAIPVAPHSKDVSWYLPGPPKLPAKIKTLLRDWSAIAPSDAEKHVERIREEAWEVHQYPCIGGYRFLTLGLVMHPSFSTVVAQLKADGEGEEAPIFMDLGCCVGQDIRSLAHAGVPGARLLGVDVEPAFVEIGYNLFRDKEKLGAQFVLADIMTGKGSSQHLLSPFTGRVSVLWASAFFHLWNLEGQLILCREIVELLQDKPGVRVLGRHVGSRVPGEKVHVTNKSGLMFRHNPETFRRMWADALEIVGNMDEQGLIQSLSHGHWKVRAWFEEDRPEETQNTPSGDWLTKVARESEGGSQDNAETCVSLDSRAIFLVWDVERMK